MSLSIRLIRHGLKFRPIYKIIVIDNKKSIKSSGICTLGFYNLENKSISIQKDLLEYWLEKGVKINSKKLQKLFLNFTFLKHN